MSSINLAETVTAVWFIVFFGLALLVPAFRAPCKAARNRRNDDESM